MSSRTLLIGLDGATFTVMDPLFAEGAMPFLKELIARGVRGQLLSTPNPLTPPAWTSLMTGRTPGNHGILDFIRAEERDGEVYFTLYNFHDIRCETIWSMISRRGMRAISLNFPMMAPPPAVNGYVVPGLTSWKHLKRNVYPPELHDQLRTMPGMSYKELAWDFELEKKVLQGGIDQEEYESWIQFHTRREQHWFDIARHLMLTDPCDLTAVMFDGTDKLQHICWRFLDPKYFPAEPSEWEARIRELCLDYFRKLDGYIEELVRLAGPEAQVFFASDHGFGPTEEVFRVNVWLHEQGYLTWRSDEPPDEAAEMSLKRRLNSNFVLLDWERTRAYARTSSSNGIYIRKGAATNGEYESFRNRLIEGLYGVVNPETGERVVQRVMTREEAFPGEQMHEAPDLTLVLRDYGFVSIKNLSPAVQMRPEVSGTHRMEGIFMASGPGIRRGENIAPLKIIDMAATLLYSLGLEIPEDMEGRVPTEVFEPSWLEAHPASFGAHTRSPVSTGAQDEADGRDVSEDALIFERLKALGYLE